MIVKRHGKQQMLRIYEVYTQMVPTNRNILFMGRVIFLEIFVITVDSCHNICRLY